MKKRILKILNTILQSPKVPNYITIGRILVTPLIMYLIYKADNSKSFSAIAAVVFLIAVLSDVLDGYLARKYNLISNLGKFLDPLADKLIVSAALIMLIPMNRINAILVFLIIARELAITGLRGIAAEQNIIIAASNEGKKKTLAQCIAIFCLIWHYPLIWADTARVGTIILYVSLAISYWSAILYFSNFHKATKTLPQALPKALPPACPLSPEQEDK